MGDQRDLFKAAHDIALQLKKKTPVDKTIQDLEYDIVKEVVQEHIGKRMVLTDDFIDSMKEKDFTENIIQCADIPGKLNTCIRSQVKKFYKKKFSEE